MIHEIIKTTAKAWGLRGLREHTDKPALQDIQRHGLQVLRGGVHQSGNDSSKHGARNQASNNEGGVIGNGSMAQEISERGNRSMDTRTSQSLAMMSLAYPKEYGELV